MTLRSDDFRSVCILSVDDPEERVDVSKFKGKCNYVLIESKNDKGEIVPIDIKRVEKLPRCRPPIEFDLSITRRYEDIHGSLCDTLRRRHKGATVILETLPKSLLCCFLSARTDSEWHYVKFSFPVKRIESYNYWDVSVFPFDGLAIGIDMGCDSSEEEIETFVDVQECISNSWLIPTKSIVYLFIELIDNSCGFIDSVSSCGGDCWVVLQKFEEKLGEGYMSCICVMEGPRETAADVAEYIEEQLAYMVGGASCKDEKNVDCSSLEDLVGYKIQVSHTDRRFCVSDRKERGEYFIRETSQIDHPYKTIRPRFLLEDVTLPFCMTFHHLSTYVILWILEFLPAMWKIKRFVRVKMIEGVLKSTRRILAQRETNAPAKINKSQ